MTSASQSWVLRHLNLIHQAGQVGSDQPKTRLCGGDWRLQEAGRNPVDWRWRSTRQRRNVLSMNLAKHTQRSRNERGRREQVSKESMSE